ncbi:MULTISPECIES: RagB/SusD family nutrient uptake outer membrane protein [unclassified Sphingobacterium]|uniref:RagB/SusD family nutrient uptake outer membrane protein n=1 Tax=unclassified Sphingobacterium TaxID=2609468 RepID=UPI0020C46D0F|nr:MULTISPECIES: RagB/SusD family nutrient uptake outer membrane protein [unclassified Sphingobacterium]
MKTKKILIAILTVFLFSSCEKILEEKPKTILSPNQFFNNPGSYESSVKGIYSGLPLYVPFTHEMITDLYDAPSPKVEQALPIYNNQPSPSYYNARDSWNGPYRIVKNANFILKYLNDAPLEEKKKNALIAESRFLRAYAFFNLVQLFGDIPLPLEVAKSYESLKLPRTPQAEVYSQILQDLQFAEDNLPEVEPQIGRVNKFVATALLARVYLTMAGEPLNKTTYYKDALEKAKTVIGSKKYSLVLDYAKVFQQLNYTSETIWDKQYVAGRGGNFIHNNSSTANGYNPSLVPSQNFIKSFPKGDRRSQWGIVENYKIGNQVLERPFIRKFVDINLIDRGVLPSAASVSYSLPLIRLAEMYLIAAEAENEINGPQNAYSYINEIRKRARLDENDITHVPDLVNLSKNQLREDIRNEWNWELYQEGFSWMIMKRTNSFDRIQKQRGSTLTLPIGNYNQTWPIPVEEIINNNIPQNPLYQ